MARTIEHIMESHSLAEARRKAGRPIWDGNIIVNLAGLTTFEQNRDAWVAALKRSAWYAKLDTDDELRLGIEEMSETDDPNEFDVVLSDVYDALDLARYWVDVRK